MLAEYSGVACGFIIKPIISRVYNESGYILLLNSNIIANTMLNREDILKINDNLFIAARTINELDSTYVIEWNGQYKFLRIKKK